MINYIFNLYLVFNVKKVNENIGCKLVNAIVFIFKCFGRNYCFTSFIQTINLKNGKRLSKRINLFPGEKVPLFNVNASVKCSCLCHGMAQIL